MEITEILTISINLHLLLIYLNTLFLEECTESETKCTTCIEGFYKVDGQNKCEKCMKECTKCSDIATCETCTSLFEPVPLNETPNTCLCKTINS